MRTRSVKRVRDGLNPKQSDIIDQILARKLAHLVCAVAGSGKTRLITYLIYFLIKELGVRPQEIIAVTFTTKAATEMNERLHKLGVNTELCRVGTFHSVCFEILKKDGHSYGGNFEVLQDPHIMMKEVTGYKGMDWKGCDLTMVESFVSLAKNALLRPDEVPVANSRNAVGGMGGKHVIAPNSKYVEAYQRFEELRTSRGKLTFDDMLIRCWELLSEVPHALRSWQSRFSWVIVDEFQDTNHAQYEITKLLGAPENNIICVGDDDQCQPPDTLVLTKFGYKRIDSLKNGDFVKVWNRHAQRFVSERPVKVSVRPYRGVMNRVFVDGMATDGTPNHKFLVRWSDKSLNKWITYIMYREDRGYRVGWCQLFNVDGAVHFGMRVRLEKADKAWIIAVHDDKRDASIQESVISAKYGIPTAMFEPNGELYDEYSLERIFSSVPRDGGERCLKDFGRDPKYPFYPIPHAEGYSKSGRNTLFPVYSSNLVPGIMSLLTTNGEWVPIDSVVSFDYEGFVHSLDVDEFHNYVADGILTLNSIYAWRGAVPEYMQEFVDEYDATLHRMEQNYRSYGRILDVANSLIVNNEVRIPKVNRSERQIGEAPTFTLCADMDDEAVSVADKLEEEVALGRRYGDFCVLYRTNAQSRAFEEEFIKRQIPHVVLGGTSFYNRKEVKDLLAYLRVISDQDPSGENAKRCANAPFRFLGSATLDKAEQLCRKGRYNNIIEAIPDIDGIRGNQLMAVQDLLRLLDDIRAMMRQGSKPSEILETVVQRTNYKEWIIREEGTDTAENSRISNILELIRTSDKFHNVEQLLTYIENLNRRRRRRTESADTVLLMTGHKSKGLEFKVVFGVGWAEKILPHSKATDIEEERRLAYVIATRAMDQLHLSSPESAYVGGGKTTTLEPSRFVNEVLGFLSVVDRLGYLDGEQPSDVY